MYYNVIPTQKVDFYFDSDELERQWKQVPMYLQPNLISTAQAIFSLINNFDNLTCPSLNYLNLQKLQKYPTVNQIYNIFRQAIDHYRVEFVKAIKADIILTTIVRDSSHDFIKAISTGAIRFAEYAPHNRIFRPIVGVPLLLFGGVYGWWMQKNITEETVRDECSFNRILWLNKVLIKEENRIEKSLELICLREKILKKDIDQLDSDLLRVDFMALLHNRAYSRLFFFYAKFFILISS